MCCSRSCNAKRTIEFNKGKPAHNRNFQTRICKWCGKIEHNLSPSIAKKPYCSRKCMQEHYASGIMRGKKHWNWQGGKVGRFCVNCGTLFFQDKHVFEKGENDGIFCSISCHAKYSYNNKGNPNWKGGDVIKRCLICNKEYPVKPSLVEKSKCCSRHCLGVYNISRQNHKDTDIEGILKEWLLENKIEHEEQKPLLGRTIVDFFIPSNVCLYADGDYWHKYPIGLDRDRKTTKALEDEGFEVIRLWGSEIKNGKRPEGLCDTL